jgi:NAD(P)-dependent dehydrogenase (short-subunit alcohol dehydrogenase family)
MRAVWESHVPMRRYGTPDEVAHAAIFLLSAESGYVTGHRPRRGWRLPRLRRAAP